MRVKRTSGPGACRAWRASHATLWGVGNPAAKPPSYMSYRSYMSLMKKWPIGIKKNKDVCRKGGSSRAHEGKKVKNTLRCASLLTFSSPTYMSYRDVLWHVADVPGVQGELLPAGAWGSAPHPSNQLISQSANQPNSSCPFVVLRVLRVSPAGQTLYSCPFLTSSPACRALSVLCSPGRAGAPSPYLII